MPARAAENAGKGAASRHLAASTMPLEVHLGRLQKGPAERQGELPAQELDLDIRDELIRVDGPLAYRLVVELRGPVLLLTGVLRQWYRFECARCLSPFRRRVEAVLEAREIPLQGEEAASVQGEHADLTPALREDILVLLPSHPLCTAGCRGLGSGHPSQDRLPGAGDPPAVWSALDRFRAGRSSQ